MSDTSNHPESAPAPQSESQAPAPTPPANPTPSAKPPMPQSTMIMGFIIMVLLGAIFASSLKKHHPANSSDTTPEETKKLETQLALAKQQNNRERLALGLPSVGDSSESVQHLSTQIKKDLDSLTTLASSMDRLLAESETRYSSKIAELVQSEQLRTSLSEENIRLRDQLSKLSSTASSSTQLAAQVESLKSENSKLLTEVEALRKEADASHGAASPAEMAELQRRLDEALRAKDFFESRFNEARKEYDTVKAKLFAASENELLPMAVQLVRSLRNLEGLPDSEFSASYNRIGTDLGAERLIRLDFATGSSTITAKDEDSIRNLVNQVPDGDLLLAIGYASTTGNTEQNRKLSSDRATAAAELYSSQKRQNQLVQAVYLGETTRFSGHIPERNQIVEIWRIRKK